MIFAALRYRCVSFCLSAGWSQCKVKMNSDAEEDPRLPESIGKAAAQGDFERVKAWLAAGSASDPRSINAGDDSTSWTLLHWTMNGDQTPGHLEFARYLLSRGARVDAKDRGGSTALHLCCGNIGRGEATAAIISMLVAAGATVDMVNTHAGRTPLFSIYHCSARTIDGVTALLRAGASLDSSTRSFEELLDGLEGDSAGMADQHVGAIRTLVASVRAAGSWKAHCRLAHKEVLRLRSLVARGRVKLPRTCRTRGRDARALEFIVRQGDNGIVWNILSYWRETG